MPEWFLLIGALAVLTLLGLSWPPLLWVTPLLIIAIAAPLAQAILSAAKANFPTPRASASERIKLRALTALLHLIQPIARLKGRLAHGLTLWRSRIQARPNWRLSESHELWSEVWRAPEAWLEDIAAKAREQQAVVRKGGAFDDWDLELRGGLLGGARVLAAVEEHGAGRQMLRFRCWQRVPVATIATICMALGLAITAAVQGAWIAAVAIGLGVVATATAALLQAARAIGALSAVLTRCKEEQLMEAPEIVSDAPRVA